MLVPDPYQTSISLSHGQVWKIGPGEVCQGAQAFKVFTLQKQATEKMFDT